MSKRRELEDARIQSCKGCGREMDRIKNDQPRYWCIHCNIEYHSDRGEGERWIDLGDDVSKGDGGNEDATESDTGGKGKAPKATIPASGGGQKNLF